MLCLYLLDGFILLRGLLGKLIRLEDSNRELSNQLIVNSLRRLVVLVALILKAALLVLILLLLKCILLIKLLDLVQIHLVRLSVLVIGINVRIF